MTASRHGVFAHARQQSCNALSASPVLPFLTSSIPTIIHIYRFNQTGISFLMFLDFILLCLFDYKNIVILICLFVNIFFYLYKSY
ncbi:hypothetical protein DW901_05875 [Firmicutes bacterium AM41-5BH]|nr:hypothetical protein DW901_05875 [Firmicutes bacterium AM41-5BH]